jgi:uncharacterized RDD family membrane protein YckC
VAVWITHTAEGVELRQELAGAGSRMIAAAVDLGILFALLLLTLFVLFLAMSFDPTGSGQFLLGLVLGGWLLIVVAYWVVFELAWNGQTPGKRALGLRVRNRDGGPVEPLQTLLRGAFFLVELGPLGFLLVAATPHGQRLGDLAAGTLVVRLPKNRGPRSSEPWPGERWSALRARALPMAPALAARFTRAEVAWLRELLARGEPAVFSELDALARRRLYVEAAREFGARIGLERFDDARIVLRELYLFLREMHPGQTAEDAQRTRSSGR